ncbi:protein of unknown function DUF1680 [Beutenbergia cavernae DSM 12333]|uniref:Glycoside hydrolase family 127 protein n=1 Tax=Beutenbergia cavernae (strain ATCC BAA-8 / DSM 12333 / CCUG 43141 / JCM 11478 / NBRC 16432 / NCIMB 13614 / HKI 0122) TaxID=471853 RepID=C5C531_BEUC1|nr:beta-L-arabinofuranosidase domain-containing protein [Beutenbergia cavernae]ACQ82171.1 protein of unknown function DUF1680 [Beutenbergia cavernae DSM 12333]
MTHTLNPTTTRRHPVNVRDVVVEDAFWGPRQQQLRATTLDAQYDQLVATGRIGSLALTWTPGSDEPRPHPFWESDIAKWLEAASYVLGTHPDAALEAKVDGVVAALAGAQQEDGYLNAYFTVVAPGERFTDLRDAHELYAAGHLIEAGVAHHESTGKTTLLDVVARYADLLVSEFGPGGAHEGGYCGHEEVELALVRLYRTTGERRYLDLALAFVDARGTTPHYFDVEQEQRGTAGFFGAMFPQRGDRRQEFLEYNQSHAPVREQSQAVGHAVRAMYLYSAMADLAAETGDEGLRGACETLWTHLTTKRMYVTGGIGDSRHNEGFTRDYVLPNDCAYAETCAAIGLVFWARRMASLSGSAQYVDVLERALYNGVIAGVSADGQKFFYENPLASDGSAVRRDWFDCACCPPNLARLEASLGSYVYAASADSLAVDLYVGSTVARRLGGADVRLRQSSSSPAGGDVALTVSSSAPAVWSLLLRAPSWARGTAVSVNGEATDAVVGEDGYVTLRREWADGDRVDVAFDVEVRRLYASTHVAADAGRTALAYGPFVYCVEGVDVEAPVHAVVLGDSALEPVLPASEVVPVLVGPASVETRGSADDAVLYSEARAPRRDVELTAVPYYSWNNRGASTMAVWLREG